MLLECPTRHRPQRHRQLVGARHLRRSRTRRLLTCAALPNAVAPDGLTGSFDPVWTAGAEGRFLAGAFRTRSRHPLIVAGRILLLVALVAPGLGPFFGAFHLTNGDVPSPVLLGLVAVAPLAVGRHVRQRRS
jgi:hypothetical protein